MKKIFALLFFFLVFYLLLLPQSVIAVDSSGEWVKVGSLSEKRMVSGVALLDNGKVIVTGGYNGHILESTELYDPDTRTWSLGGELNTGRMLWLTPNLVKFSDGRIFVATGEGPTPIGSLASSEIYDPAINKWSFVAPALEARFRAVIAPLPGDKVLVASGTRHTERFLTSAEIYDLATNTWSKTGSMHIGRENDQAYAVLNDGRVLIAGGEANGEYAEDTSEVYSPVTGQWELSQMPYGFRGGTLTVLNDGRVLAAGGYLGPTSVDSTALYDPQTDTWSQGPSMPAPRARHSAILLSDGKVMVLGGYSAGEYFDTTFLYDPSTNSWTEGSDLPSAVAIASVAQLQNGDYLLIGGEVEDGFSSEVYLFTQSPPVSSLSLLPVPLFKQTDPLWSDDIYDTASRWASDPSFSRWGCAVTSAAMVFNYNGLKRMEDGNALTPGALNEWLKSQPDGYVGDGLTNWMALARLSKSVADENGVSFDALDYKRVWSSDNQVVRDGIDNNLPSILQVPGHFVAATGYDDENIYINDPFYSRDDLTQYNNTFKNISQFIPSNTDLSAIMIVADKDMGLSVRDSSGEVIGSGRIQEPIIDPNDPSVVSSAKASNIVEIFDPASGEYKVELSGGKKGNYSFQVYLYDKEGDVKVLSFEGTMIGDSVAYNLNFNKEDGEQSAIQEEVSFESILNGLKLLFQDAEIKNYGTYKSLSERFENARKFSDNLPKTKSYLENIKKSVDQFYKTGKISSLSNDYLIGRIDVLLRNY